MAAAKHREEHANTLVAQILRGLGIDAQAETKGRKDRKHPDLIIRSDRADILIEAKYGNHRAAEESADSRLSSSGPNLIEGLTQKKGGNAHAVIGAISYSAMFEDDPHEAVRKGGRVDFAFKRADEGKGGWSGRWRTDGTVYDLAQSLRRPYAIVSPLEDQIRGAVQNIASSLDDFAESFYDSPGAQEAVAKALQASLPVAGKERKDALEKSMRLAGLILLGALLFQFALFDKKTDKVKNPRDYENGNARITDITDHWRYILEEINYSAIFRVALTVMKDGNIRKPQIGIIAKAAANVQDIARDGVDLMGVVYHELLAELAKPLGAFYTTIPAATMLSSLALNSDKWDGRDWSKPKTVADFRVGDLACGSGTLLAAACSQISDNVMRAHFHGSLTSGAKTAKNPLEAAHRTMLEKTVWGYDVLETAVHLTATTIGLMAPEVDFGKSHIYRAALGKAESGDRVYTGSFQLLESERVWGKLFDSDAPVEHVETGNGDRAEPLPPLDLCIMNPPFVVGRKNALSYSFLPKKDADAVRGKMNQLARDHGFNNAGLGPGFVTLGEKYIKPGGRMAFILSTTVATGRSKAWQKARARIEKTCDLELFITSRDSEHTNFSYGTNLQECMFIARKRKDGEEPKDRAMFVILSQNPQTGEAARAVADAILRAEKSGDDWGELHGLGDKVIGEFARLPYREFGTWDGIAFSNLRLTMAAGMFASEGRIPPYSRGESFVPVRKLGEMADFGSARLQRYTNDPEIKEKAKRYLAFSQTPTAYAGYYPGRHKRQAGVANKDNADIAEKPNCYFLPLPKCEKWAEKYFSWGGRIVINLTFRFNTSRRLASLISTEVQCANYQPVRLHKDTDERAKAMTLWLNSTLGTLLMATYSVYCQGAKVMLSQQAARDLPVLDLDKLSAKQLKALAAAFDKAAKRKLRPLPEMADDKARIAIDDALAKTLNLQGFDFDALRKALAAEPIICGR